MYLTLALLSVTAHIAAAVPAATNKPHDLHHFNPLDKRDQKPLAWARSPIMNQVPGCSTKADGSQDPNNMAPSSQWLDNPPGPELPGQFIGKDCNETVRQSMPIRESFPQLQANMGYPGEMVDEVNTCWTSWWLYGHRAYYSNYTHLGPEIDCRSSSLCRNEDGQRVQNCVTTTSQISVGMEIIIKATLFGTGVETKNSLQVAFSTAEQHCTLSTENRVCQWDDDNCHSTWYAAKKDVVYGYMARQCNATLPLSAAANIKPSVQLSDGSHLVGAVDFQFEIPLEDGQVACDGKCGAGAYPEPPPAGQGEMRRFMPGDANVNSLPPEVLSATNDANSTGPGGPVQSQPSAADGALDKNSPMSAGLVAAQAQATAPPPSQSSEPTSPMVLQGASGM